MLEKLTLATIAGLIGLTIAQTATADSVITGTPTHLDNDRNCLVFDMRLDPKDPSTFLGTYAIAYSVLAPTTPPAPLNIPGFSLQANNVSNAFWAAKAGRDGTITFHVAETLNCGLIGSYPRAADLDIQF